MNYNDLTEKFNQDKFDYEMHAITKNELYNETINVLDEVIKRSISCLSNPIQFGETFDESKSCYCEERDEIQQYIKDNTSTEHTYEYYKNAIKILKRLLVDNDVYNDISEIVEFLK